MYFSFFNMQVTRKLTPRKSSTSQDDDPVDPAHPFTASTTNNLTYSPSTAPTQSNMAAPVTQQPDAVAMATPPRKQYVPDDEVFSQEPTYPISPAPSSQMVASNQSVAMETKMEAKKEEQEAPVSREETKKVVPRRRVSSKAKLAINFGGN